MEKQYIYIIIYIYACHTKTISSSLNRVLSPLVQGKAIYVTRCLLGDGTLVASPSACEGWTRTTAVAVRGYFAAGAVTFGLPNMQKLFLHLAT